MHVHMLMHIITSMCKHSVRTDTSPTMHTYVHMHMPYPPAQHERSDTLHTHAHAHARAHAQAQAHHIRGAHEIGAHERVLGYAPRLGRRRGVRERREEMV